MERVLKRCKIEFAVKSLYKMLNGDVIITTTCGEKIKFKHENRRLKYNLINKRLFI